MSDIDQQFIEYVVKSLVGKPEAVHIDRRIDEKGVLLELTVDPEDLGRVIGKRGATAQSLRTLLRALGTKNDARYNLKIIDNGTQGPALSSDDTALAPVAAVAARTDSVSDSNDTTPTTEPVSAAAPTEPMEPATTETSEASSEPQPETSPQSPAAASDEDKTSDRLKQARAELADLDDLDV